MQINTCQPSLVQVLLVLPNTAQTYDRKQKIKYIEAHLFLKNEYFQLQKYFPNIEGSWYDVRLYLRYQQLRVCPCHLFLLLL